MNEKSILIEKYINGSDYTVALNEWKGIRNFRNYYLRNPFIILLQNIILTILFIDILKKLSLK